MASVSFHPDARDEYDAELQWYQSRSPRAAAGFESEVDRVIGAIAADPEKFAVYDDDHRYAIMKKYPFSIVYRITAEGVRVVALAHAKRRQGYWAGRE